MGKGPPFGLELVWQILGPEGSQRLPEGSQKAPGQDLAQNGRFPRIPEGEFDSRPKGLQMAEICLQKAPGQDLGSQEAPRGSQKAPKGSQRLPEGSQKAPGQDLAQNGRFPRIPEGEFDSRPKGLQMAEICLQKAPGQDLGSQEAPRGSQKAPRRLPEAPRRLSKGSRPGFGPKRPFPKDPRRDV